MQNMDQKGNKKGSHNDLKSSKQSIIIFLSYGNYNKGMWMDLSFGKETQTLEIKETIFLNQY